MKRIGGRLGAVLVVVVIFSIVFPVAADAVNVGGTEVSSAGAFVMDFESGLELFAYNADTQRVPASMTKLLAAYVVYDAIGIGEIRYDSVATISQSVSTFSKNREWSNIPMQTGAEITVDKLLEFVIVYSSCAATDALAEALCGSVGAFVQRMNDKVRQLDLNAVFFDTFGGSANNRITPREMAILAKCLIADYPDVLKKASMAATSYLGVSYKNTNQLLGVYDGVDGLKTGYTGAAGYCFIATAERNGRRLISVTMGSSSVSTRFPDTVALLDYGFSAIGLPEQRRGDVYPSSSTILVNGVPATLSFFNIDGYHYFKLRDIAFLLTDTEKEFEAQWNDELKTVFMTSGTPYTAQGDELTLAPNALHSYAATSSAIFLDNGECGFDVYNIDDYNYFKLRDIAALIDFWVGWDEQTHTVYIDTSHGYEAPIPEDPTEEPDDTGEPDGTEEPDDLEEPDDSQEEPEDLEEPSDTDAGPGGESEENTAEPPEDPAVIPPLIA